MKNAKRVMSVLLVAVVLLSTLAACGLFGGSPEKKIIGTWRDSTGMSGFEFKEGGACVITPLEVSIIDTSYNGTYTVEKAEDDNYYVTITYTVLYASRTERYMFSVQDSSLTLTKVNDDGTFGSPIVYMAYETAVTTAAPTAAQ